MQFNKLRLSGFKSFVDPMELHIEAGLTGVVGPNGCGKSNLVEALRWVMGETSAKRMRGGAMDDVIFSGTQSRPARNMAEVAMVIDNANRTAPPAFNDADELVITRTIERESGSAYRINGAEVRARDVQLLFADAASGAQSPSLVSQGRIGAIVAAKPVERRALLEEAAGITGLHSRRHEAELRLRGAETNLERLDDVMQALEAQLQNIKRQARQANRYRKLGGEIRRSEAILLHQLYARAEAGIAAARAELEVAEAGVAELTGASAQANVVHAQATEQLPDLRHAEAEAGAALHRLSVARDTLDQEEARLNQAIGEAEGRLRQLGEDTGRERLRSEDAEAALQRLMAEAEELRQRQAGDAAAQESAAVRVNEAGQVVAAHEQELERLTDHVANQAAQRDSLSRTVGEAERRLGKLGQRLAETAAGLQRIEAELARNVDIEVLRQESEMAAANLASARDAREQGEEERRRLEAALADANENLQDVRGIDATMAAEQKALTEVLQVDDAGLWPPLIDAVEVQPGYEAALGAALGEDLAYPADEAAPIHWQTFAGYAETTALPENVVAIATLVRGPAALDRRLSQIGLVDDADGARLAGQLGPGQRLVSKSGAMWRWDGFTVTANAESAAAVRLAQRNRLQKVVDEREAVSLTLANAETRRLQAKAALDAAGQVLNDAREAARRAERDFTERRDRLGAAERDTAARSSRRAGLQETHAQIAADMAETEAQQAEAVATLEGLPSLDAARETLAELRRKVADARSLHVEARNDEGQIRRDAAMRRDRLAAIGTEAEEWRRRAETASVQLAELEERRRVTEEQLTELRRQPGEIAAKRSGLLDRLQEAEAARNAAADRLAEAETLEKSLASALRDAEHALSAAREQRVRQEGAVEKAGERREEIVRRIAEALECEPDGVLAAGGVDADETLPAPDEMERRLERLKRERDRMGPVNLRAEQEAVELEEQLETMQSERADLEGAIARLRSGISSLNREGRERLLAAFKTVDEHFQSLFVRLFGGGKAHLELIESDDPLEAGLEIMASPPGKRLQRLSLLSGGEQAMTALSLLFAVFMTNPAPVCVLDEVDAPLDDANVERFTNLVGEIAGMTGTRFLIITHHPYTMARMDRLFGVTMAERGVSQLVSIDLARAERIRATA